MPHAFSPLRAPRQRRFRFRSGTVRGGTRPPAPFTSWPFECILECRLTNVAAVGGVVERAEALASLVSTARFCLIHRSRTSSVRLEAIKPMEPRTVGAVINVIVMTGYAVVAGWRGYHRRRDYWTRGSWVGLGLVGVLGVACLALAFMITLAVDNHETWVGAPRSSTRSGYALLALGAMTGGVLLVAGSLGWFALGEPSRQFPLLGSHKSESPTPLFPPPASGAAIDDSPPSA